MPISALTSSPTVQASITEAEIARQPDVWRKTAGRISKQAEDIRDWIERLDPQEIWFCGAGSSSYIGETLADYLTAHTGRLHKAVATTSLLATPQDYIGQGRQVLVISFGRSGDSPESTGVLDLLDQHMPTANRLNITCNKNSSLAQHSAPTQAEQKVIILPEEAHDEAFAMTISFTTMVFMVLACLDTISLEEASARMLRCADAAPEVLGEIEALCSTRFFDTPERVYFLGSGALTGIARESALKVLEMTRGQIATSWETPLGFRHGPKASILCGARVFILASTDDHTRKYDQDLIAELRQLADPASVVVVGPKEISPDIIIQPVGNDAWSAAQYLMTGQMLGAHWGKKLGISIDNPFEKGQLTRVVAGVPLYPFSRQPHNKGTPHVWRD